MIVQVIHNFQLNILVGIFSDKKKANQAVEALASKHQGVTSREDHPGESLISCGDGSVFQITDWEVNKALVNQEWVVL